MKSRSDHQRGSVTTEFILVAPLLAIAMLFLMGLGYSLMTKQNAIVGARVAVYYQASREGAPPVAINSMIKNAVSPDREDWSLVFNERNMDDPENGSAGMFESAVEGIYQEFNRRIQYTARGTATLGFLPRIMNLGQARGNYSIPRGTWTCEQTGGGSYTSVTLGAMGLPSPINGWLDLSCCKTYPATYR